MTEARQPEARPEPDPERKDELHRPAWQRPELRRIDAGDAEATLLLLGADLLFS